MSAQSGRTTRGEIDGLKSTASSFLPRRVQDNIRKYQKIVREVLENQKNCKIILENCRKLQKMLENCRECQKIVENYRNYFVETVDQQSV